MISVVIPVYNAEKFIRKAVESVLIQPKVSEIILVEDASPGNALAVCQQLYKENPEKIKLFQHPDKGNHGAGASRNLGIEKASSKYIAFLDADDYYLPGRFKNDIKILESDPSIDGIYNALGTDVIDKSEMERAKEKYGEKQLSTVFYPIPPDKLFEEMFPLGNQGWFHLDCITLRKKVFEKVGLFQDLEISEDTLLFLKIAATHKLVSGIINKPVAMRGVHTNNRIKNEEKFRQYQPIMFRELLEWGNKNASLNKGRKEKVWDAYYRSLVNKQIMLPSYNMKLHISRYSFLLKSLFMYPFLLTSLTYYKKLPLLHRFI